MIDLSYKPQLITRMYIMIEDTWQCTIHTIHCTMSACTSYKIKKSITFLHMKHCGTVINHIGVFSAYWICPSCFCFTIFLLVCKSATFSLVTASVVLSSFHQHPGAGFLRDQASRVPANTKKCTQLIYFPLLCSHIVFQFNLHCTTTRANYATTKHKKDEAVALQCLSHT